MTVANAVSRALVGCGALIVAAQAGAALPIESWRTPTGAKVLFVEAHQLPILDVAVEFPAGSGRDPAGKFGLANVTLQLARMGAGQMDENEISRRFADVGAQVSQSFDVDRAGLSLRTLSSPAEMTQALDVFAAVLQAPTFAAAVLEREKARIAAALREAQTRPTTVVEKTFLRLAYGTHPYGHLGAGEPETVTTITREDVVGFRRAYYSSDDAVVAIIGDVTREQAQRIGAQLTSELPRASRPLPALPPVPRPQEPVSQTIAFPATQAYLRIGMPGMARGDPDYVPLWLGNHILGGSGFSSRLMIELREKRALAYGPYSYFAPFALDGPFALAAQTKKGQSAQALSVMRETLEKFVRDGPGEEELAAAKQNVIGGFALRIDTNSKILGALSTIGFYSLPLDYLETFPQRIAAVTREQVRDAFRRRIDPSRMVTVVVGPDPQP